MWYAVIAEDVPDSLAGRLAVREAHLERLKALQNDGRLLLAGPLPAIDSPDPGPAGFTGSPVVAGFRIARGGSGLRPKTPYTGAGVYARASAPLQRKVLPQHRRHDARTAGSAGALLH